MSNNGDKINNVNKKSKSRKKGSSGLKKGKVERLKLDSGNIEVLRDFVNKNGGVILNAESNQLGDIKRIDRVEKKWMIRKVR